MLGGALLCLVSVGVASAQSRLDSVITPARSAGPAIQTRFVYDPITQRYLLTTYVGGKVFGVPTAYTYEEYLRYLSTHQQGTYWDELFDRSRQAGQSRPRQRNPLDMSFDSGALGQVFGPGGVRLRLQGSADLSAGLKSTYTDNPALSQRSRRQTFFDFDERIQAAVQASVGTKLNFDMNYNTASTFDFDAKRLKLVFTGEEDDMVKLIEMGGVSMSPQNSLISGGGQLFGLHTKLQFGRLELDLLASQQRTQSRRVSTQGGAQMQSFEFSASNYDADRHYFLSDVFRRSYNEAMRTLPAVRSAIQITRLEVWITNRRGRYDQARNILALADLGEPLAIHSDRIQRLGTADRAGNGSNDLYQTLTSRPELRQLDAVTTQLQGFLRPALDYEKIESARRLDPSEYTFNPVLGTLSLSVPLRSDEVLGVAYEYTWQGEVYRVGEFASDRPDATEGVLFVKLLKGTDRTPDSPYWPLMMRNVYSLGTGVRDVQSQDFRLDILYRDDAVGTSLPYLPSSEGRGRTLLSLVGLDRLDAVGEPRSDGRFDFVEGYTIRSSEGLVYFPTLEPFGATIIDSVPAPNGERYAFSSLYRRTLTEARQDAEHNKYLIKGSYRASNSSEISLGMVGVTPGSVRVTASGQVLQEGTDYSVDYLSGTVRILNGQLLAARTPIDVSLQGGSELSQQRKTVLGVDANYHFTKNLRLGATLMHLSELPLSGRTQFGQESMKNTMWGASLNYQNRSMNLTNWLNKLPLLDLTSPSSLSFSAEVAQLFPGHYEDRYSQGRSYLDDFQSSRSTIDLSSPYSWHLSSTPQRLAPQVTQPADYLRYGERRARLAWFSIDPLFTRERSSLTPAYVRNDPSFVSNHFVREIPSSELYPYRDQNLSQPSYLPTLSLSYYPTERGPYNLSADRIGSNGQITEPTASWGGIMRSLDQTDFEAAGVEYLEFWMMDPFVYAPQSLGGEMYLDLGEISEDILHDEKKFYENGLPQDGDPAGTIDTPWGKVPSRPSIGYSFDNASGARARQDVGLNGLSTAEELAHPTYAAYVAALRAKLSPEVLALWEQDPFSPINDPGGDNFHHYRGDDYDAARLPILDRYKHFNGTEGNSSEQERQNGYSLTGSIAPDVEDINGDNTMNELDRYYEYRISLRPEDMQAGRNYIVGERTARVTLRDGQNASVRWFQFKIPVRSYTNRVGGVADFRSMRFMRMWLTNFAEPVQVRLASLQLVRGDWRPYAESLEEAIPLPEGDDQLSLSAVNIEEHGDREPINYVLPPGVSRTLDAQQSQSLQQNQQALALKVRALSPGTARAVYRNVNYDLRRYRKLQLFVHAEQLLEDDTQTQDGELSLFLRLGSDYRSNYYEYSVPLQLTAPGRYSNASTSDREAVWPTSNFIDLSLEGLIALKRERNSRLASVGSGITLNRLYTRPDADAPQHQMAVMGNPSLSNVRTLMIGVRNSQGQTVRSIEVWVGELRVGDYHEEMAWAANAQMSLQLAELGAVNVRGQYTSAGFGAIDVPLSARSLESRRSISVSSNAELGKLFPEKARLSIPIYYSLSDELTKPEYNPTDQDVRLTDALESAPTEEARRELRAQSISQRTTRGFSITGMRLGIASKRPMPYDPANLTFSFGHHTTHEESPEIAYHHRLDWQASVRYDYVPTWRGLRPFASLKGDGGWRNFLRDYSVMLWPQRLNLETSLTRNYQEEQLRNLTSEASGAVTMEQVPVSFSQQFVWARKMQMQWMPLTDMNITLSAGTDARVEEPHVQVNRSLNPDGWLQWRDAVLESLRQGGTPLHYGQTLVASWNLPTGRIPALDWFTTQLAYNGIYTWDRGADTGREGEAVAHRLSAQRTIDLSPRIDFRRLYNKIPLLARLEREYAATNNAQATPAKGKDSKKKPAKSLLQRIGERLLYTLMSPRELTVNYRETSSTLLSGFLPEIQAVGGQAHSTTGPLSPGLGFALGLTGADYITTLADRGDLLNDPLRPTPGIFSTTRTTDVRATLQPFPEFLITLTANHTRTSRQELQYMYADRPSLYGGDFTMTTIGLRGFFSSLGASSGYASEVFERFRAARATIAQRYQSSYRGTQPTVPLELNSSAVLLPAFRSAYFVGQSPERVSLSAVPSLLSFLPNWSINYTGLSRLSLFKRYFRSVGLRHSYRGTYSLGGFSSFARWQGADPDGIGLRSVGDGAEAESRLSYAYDFNAVSLQESFFPLLGLDLTWKSGLTLTSEWRRSRGLVLNLASFSLLESRSNELNVGLNYKVADIRQLFRPRPRPRRGRGRQTPQQTSAKGLTLHSDYSYRQTASLLRRLEEGTAQATSGLSDHRIRLSAEYELSRMVALRAFYEWTRSNPLVSTYSFPMTTTNFGLSLRLSLLQ